MMQLRQILRPLIRGATVDFDNLGKDNTICPRQEQIRVRDAEENIHMWKKPSHTHTSDCKFSDLEDLVENSNMLSPKIKKLVARSNRFIFDQMDNFNIFSRNAAHLAVPLQFCTKRCACNLVDDHESKKQFVVLCDAANTTEILPVLLRTSKKIGNRGKIFVCIYLMYHKSGPFL